MAAKKGSALASAFMGTAQGRVAVMIAIMYTICTFMFGLSPAHILGGVLKLAILAYSINCMVAGNCNALGWLHVLSLAVYCAVDMGSLIHVDRELRAFGGGLFMRPMADTQTYSEARARMDRA